MKLKEIANELFEISQQLSELEKRREQLRRAFFELATDTNKYSSSVLPVKSIQLPANYFEQIDISKEEFFATRYPSWIITASREDDNEWVYILMKNPKYISWEYEDYDTSIKITKMVSESTPEVDWNTLSKEAPDLFLKLRKAVTHYELDQEAWAELVGEQPEIVPILQRHLTMKPPVEKLGKPVRIDDNEE